MQDLDSRGTRSIRVTAHHVISYSLPYARHPEADESTSFTLVRRTVLCNELYLSHGIAIWFESRRDVVQEEVSYPPTYHNDRTE